MPTVLIALPVPPGTTEEKAVAFAKEINGRLAEFEKSRASLGVTQEAWAVQDLPDGSKLFILCLGGDVQHSFDPPGKNMDYGRTPMRQACRAAKSAVRCLICCVYEK